MVSNAIWVALASMPILAASQALSKVLATESAFSSFHDVLQHHDLLKDLDSERNITCFIPNNDAIQYLSDFGINLTTADPAIAKALLAYGLIDGIHASERLTAFGKTRRFRSHLMPPLFTSITEGQSVNIRVQQKEDGVIIALETGLQILTEVVQRDISFDHGVLHGTKTNMVLPENISDTTRQNHMTGYFELMKKSGTEAQLNNIVGTTYFVPSNKAIAKYKPLLNMLTPEQLATVVLQHVTTDQVLYEDMVNHSGLLLKSLFNSTIQIDRDSRGELRVNGHGVRAEDMLLTNGVAYLIDDMILLTSGELQSSMISALNTS